MARILYVSPELARDAIYLSHLAIVEGGSNLIYVVSAPSSPTGSGTFGNIAISGQYFYVCTGTNKWGRTPISSFSLPLYFNTSDVYWNNSNIYFNQTTYSP